MVVDQKDAARFLVKHALCDLDFGDCELWVRVNKGELPFKIIARRLHRYSLADPRVVPVLQVLYEQFCTPVVQAE